MAKCKSIGIISIKGGVGKTTTVVNLGATLVKDFGQKVLLVDGNLSSPNLGYHVGMAHQKVTLKDVITSGADVKTAVYKHQLGFDVLPADYTPNVNKLDPFALKSILSDFQKKYDIILIDSSPNLNNEMLLSMAASNELFVITTPDMPTLRCTVEAVNAAKSQNTPIKGIIVNKKRGKSFEVSQKDIEEQSNTPVVAVLPDDVSILEALAKATPMAYYGPRKKVTKIYRDLARCIVNDNFGKPLTVRQKFKNFVGQFISVEEETAVEEAPKLVTSKFDIKSEAKSVAKKEDISNKVNFL
jgi:septum site-determining protein MinD